MKNLSILLLTCFTFSFLNAQVNCTDCPNSTFVGGIMTSTIDIVNPGDDDISQNPLEQVCLTLQHSWLSDVVISLESPDGLHYVLMGDDDNTWGGCNSGAEDNVDVCFVLGTDAPLTNGTPYGNFCSGGNYCLLGDYTPSCGAATFTPDFLGEQAPNCDINDYNVPGNTISGLWTLRIYCVCMIELDATLDTWSLHFNNGNALTTNGGSGSTCIAYGGTGPASSSAAFCEYEAGQMSFVPQTEPGQDIPDGNGYSYGSLIVNSNDNVVSFITNSEFNTASFSVGLYSVYGISYNSSAQSSIINYVGTPISTVQAQEGTDAQHCFNLSEESKEMIIEDQEESSEVHYLCHGEPMELYGETFSVPGNYLVELDVNQACDALVALFIQEDEGVSFEKIYPRACPGESITISAENGSEYNWSGPNGFTSNSPTISLNNPDESDSGIYTCEVITVGGCIHEQVTELSLRCESRPVDLEIGNVVTFDFDGVVSTSDECQDNDENVVSIGISDQSVTFWAQTAGTEQICFQAYENGLLKNLTYEVTVENVTGVDDLDIRLTIRPNPASDYLEIDAFGVPIEYVRFFDTKGAQIKSATINDSNKTIGIADLSSGLYILQIKTNKGVVHRKLIVN